jgi:hypothetical protein
VGSKALQGAEVASRALETRTFHPHDFTKTPILFVVLLACSAALLWMREPAIRLIKGSSAAFRVWLLLSLMVAVISFFPPLHTMPLDYHLAIWSSLPLSAVWTILALTLLLVYRKLGLWTLIGLPAALFWPLKLALQGLPGCYWTGNCS